MMLWPLLRFLFDWTAWIRLIGRPLAPLWGGSRKRKALTMVAAFVVVIVLIAALAPSEDSDDPSRSTNVAEPAEPAEPDEPAEPEEPAKERTRQDVAEDCLSAWDGNHDELEGLIRAQLNDPDSMTTHGTYFSADDDLSDGTLTLKLDYGARNQLGGMVRTTAWAEMNLDCSIREVTDYGF